MNIMPVVEGLKEYINENVTPFYMPGHKNNIRGFEELEFIAKNLYRIDNTEVEGLDNLHIPQGIILEGERLLARAYSSDRSYFLVNGSTCGIYSMIMGLTKPNDKVIVQRNCHRSVFMACMMGDLDAFYINPEISEEFGIAVSIDVDKLIEVMDKNKDAKAVVVTYPTYYGTCLELERIVCEAHKRNMLVLVDEAHGAHLYFNNRLPKGAMELGADAAVTSLHKTTPSLTQTAVLNVGKGISKDGIEFMLRLFQSTSPSYVLMASMDSARYIMETRGEELLDSLIENINAFKERVLSIGCYNILGSEHIGKNHIHDIDVTKIVIKSKMGGRKLESLLRKEYKIQVEMSDAYNIVALCSIGDGEDSFKRLYRALLECKSNDTNYEKTEFHFPIYKTSMKMREAYYSKKTDVRIREAEGFISAEIAAPYPPGIPILLPGEVITREIIESIEFYKSKEVDINGLSDSKADYIKVIQF